MIILYCMVFYVVNLNIFCFVLSIGKFVYTLRNILPQFHHFRMVPKESQVSHYSFQDIPTTVPTLVVLE